jgi:hypothetical protein
LGADEPGTPRTPSTGGFAAPFELVPETSEANTPRAPTDDADALTAAQPCWRRCLAWLVSCHLPARGLRFATCRIEFDRSRAARCQVVAGPGMVVMLADTEVGSLVTAGQARIRAVSRDSAVSLTAPS